jgi:hypothetical protein
MANMRIATATRNAMLDALVAKMNLGSGPATLKMYSGAQPANANTAPGVGNTLLGTLTFSDPAASGAAAGVVTFDAITEDSAADATDTATWARIADSDGNAVFDGDIDDTDGMIILNTTSIVTGGPIRISSFTVTLPASVSF